MLSKRETSMTYLVHLIAILLTCKTQLVASYGSGAPATACATLDPSPGHGASTANDPSPYNLTFSATSYKPGEVIEVTLNGAPFKGFLIVARPTLGSSGPVGNFSAGNNSKVQCSGPNGNGVTHNSGTVKSSISFNWTAPSTSVGSVEFHYTVIRGGAPNATKHASDYFKDLKSVPLLGPVAVAFKKNPECGTSRGCLSDCVSGTCSWEATWKNAGNKYQFTIKSIASDNTYVSLGFSNTSAMSPASVVSCVMSNGEVSVNASINEKHGNRGLTNPQEGISNETNSYNGGILECSFYRDTVSSDAQVYNLTEPWYLIIAEGDVDAAGNLKRHSRTARYSTAGRINLSDATTDDTFGVATTPVPVTTTPISPVSKFQKDPECGKTKGCYSNCNNNNECDLLASWENKGNYFEITLKSGFAAPGDNYVAFGLSQTITMGPASVLACTSYQGKQGAYASYNDADHGNSPLKNNTEGLFNVAGSYSGGVLTCTLSRETSSNNPNIYDLKQQWYIVTARGVAGQGGDLAPHTVADTSVWSSKVDFTDPTVDISLETPDYPLIKAHGCLMVITWVLAASIGLTMARFFKKMWPDSKLGGVKIWFAVHRVAMVAAFVLGITAFILIFIQVKGYSETTGPAYVKAHPVLGIMVTALLFINPFISLLRCAPDHPQRELFNWVHWCVGTSAHILGGVTIVLGLYMPKALLDADKGLVVMIVYGSWYIIFFLIMTQLDYKSNAAPSKTLATGGHPLELTDVPPDSIDKSGSDAKDAFSQNGVTGLTSVKYGLLNGINEPPLSGVKKLLTLFHAVMLTSITIALIYLIVNGSF